MDAVGAAQPVQPVQPGQLQSPARVLVVDDHPTLVRVMELTLNHGTYVTRSAADGDAAAALLRQWRPHLVVLDMEVAGGRLLPHLRAGAPGAGRLPVLALTRRGDLRTKLEAFERGVDDIMTLPFPPEELLARVIALVRRSYPDAAAFAPVIRLGDLEIDILHRSVRAGASELHLTALEQSLLYLLAANAGRVVAREEILDALWGSDYVAESNVVDRQVRNLRARLQNDWRRPRFVATVPGRGYRFPPTFRDDEAPPPA